MGMPGFWAFVGDARSILSWVVKVSALAPLLTILVKIGPPWPNTYAAAVLSSVTAVVVFALSYEFMCRRPLFTPQWVLQIALVIGVVLLVWATYSYFNTLSLYVIDMPDAEHRVVIGYEMHPNVRALADSDPSRFTNMELLKSFDEANDVWTIDSITRVRILLLLQWLVVWASLLFVLSAFVALQRQSSSVLSSQ
jgi:hypothetical protein